MNETVTKAHPKMPGWLSAGQIPSLDGIRALSVILIVFYHGAMNGDDSVFDGWKWIWRNGEIGVDIFFAISGFLISTLLFREWDRTSGISLLGFYTRRSVRIIPPLMVYLLFIFALDGMGVVSIPLRDWLASLTYTVNFFDGVAIPLGHLWSLSVEEHFYLLWPPIVLCLGPQRSGRVALVCLACEPVARWLTVTYTSLDIDFVTWARLDAIAGGCWLAAAGRGGVGFRLLELLDRKPSVGFMAASSGLLLSLFVPSRFVEYKTLLSPTLNAFLICGLLWLLMRGSDTVYGRVLDSASLRVIGRMSYSLYLWQQVFLDWHNVWWGCRFPQNVFLFVGCAWCSYVLIEVPIGRWKTHFGKKLEVEEASGHSSKAPAWIAYRAYTRSS
jgi:peptidoglycan/LPS O-acetylase OafA/YrhL